MAKHEYDLGVIGGGAAGLTVAAGAARLGVKVLLVEKEPVLGGDCLHYGCVPSKALIKTARVRHLMRSAESFGLPRAELGRVDFARVAERIAAVIAAIQEHDSEERFCRLGVKTVFGEPRFVDEHQIEVDGKRSSAAKWVLAMGSGPAVPSIDGLAETGFTTNRDIFSLDELPSRLVVLGGGPIACEMAQAFSRLGSEVMIVQRSAHLLTGDDADLADAVRTNLEREGVGVFTDTAIRKVRRTGSAREVVFEQAGEERIVRGDMILAALGRRVNVDGLELDNAGVEHSPKGVPVDAKMRTNRKHIYAAGDATGSHQFTHAAGYEGSIVVSNAVFHLPRKADYTWLPWCTYVDPELASIGMNERMAAEAGIACEVIREEFAANDRALAEGESGGVLKLLLDEKEKPLGVQILGLHAGELLGEWAGVLSGKVSLTSLAGAIHAYPTLAEISKRAAGTLVSRKIFSEKVKKGLHLLFHYKGRACERD